MATTATAAPARPCSVRVTASMVMLGAIAQSREAAACTDRPMSSGLRRPNASESGPMIN